VRRLALRRACDQVVRGGAHQRVAEREASATEAHEPRVLRRRQRVRGDPERAARGTDACEVRAVASGRDDERRPRGLRQPRDAACEEVREAASRTERRLYRMTTGTLLGAQGGRELAQRERVAGGSVEHRVARCDREPEAGIGDDRARGRSFDRREAQRLQRVDADRGMLALAEREDHGDARAVEPARREQQALGGRTVGPLRVVDQHQQGATLRRRAQQRQRREAHREAVALRRWPERERPEQRRTLRLGQVAGRAEQRLEQRVQDGERKPALGLGAARGERRADVARARRSEQRGLADARLAAQHQCFAAPVACGVDQARETLLLGCATAEDGRVGLARSRPTLLLCAHPRAPVGCAARAASALGAPCRPSILSSPRTGTLAVA